MKRILILAALCCTLPLQAQWFRQPTPNDTLQSTRVLPDGKVLFQVYAPEAESVAVTGELPLFGEDMVRSIIPFVEANYRVIADQAHRAQAGHSWITWRADLEVLAPTLFR